ncbi:hypothetical protein [Quadrisphaera setariae]|uniref:SLOG cluster 4 domain-containing protein n=1 Tax=Quadrisphaera setariae TaxID=2593304 RepID=UPI00164FADFF|nr:hypothetical protein [Quadrisphaera setariae]
MDRRRSDHERAPAARQRPGLRAQPGPRRRALTSAPEGSVDDDAAPSSVRTAGRSVLERRAARPVGVIGPGADDATEAQVREAELVGLGLARAGVPVICGGLFGVMDGVARGVRAGGGDVTGVVPGTDVSVANPALTHIIAGLEGHPGGHPRRCHTPPGA